MFILILKGEKMKQLNQHYVPQRHIVFSTKCINDRKVLKKAEENRKIGSIASYQERTYCQIKDHISIHRVWTVICKLRLTINQQAINERPLNLKLVRGE